MITPFLQLISDRTGLDNVTILAASAPKESGGDYRCVGVHHGQTVRTKQNVAQFDPEAYRNQMVGTFINYVAATSGASAGIGEVLALTCRVRGYA